MARATPTNEEFANFLSKLAQLENVHTKYKIENPEKYKQMTQGELSVFKDFNQVRSLTDAANIIRELPEPVIDKIDKGEKITRIGKDIIKKLKEFAQYGITDRFAALSWRYAGSPEIYLIPGVGLEKTRSYAQEDIWTIDQLKQKRSGSQDLMKKLYGKESYIAPPIGIYESEEEIEEKRIPLTPEEENSIEKILELVRVFEFPDKPSRRETTPLKPLKFKPTESFGYYARSEQDPVYADKVQVDLVAQA